MTTTNHNQDNTESKNLLPEYTKNSLGICPLLTIASCSLPTPEGLKQCEGSDCVWFDSSRGCCGAALPSHLRGVQ